jgi:hypothetical protein
MTQENVRSGRSWAGWAIGVTVIGGVVATVVFLVWTLFVVDTVSAGEGDTYGWVAWAKNLPAVAVMLVPPGLGLWWGGRARGSGEPNGTAAVVLAGLGLFWSLLVTNLAGLVSAFGDPPDWTGFWLLLVKAAIAVAVTALVLKTTRPEPVAA